MTDRISRRTLLGVLGGGFALVSTGKIALADTKPAASSAVTARPTAVWATPATGLPGLERYWTSPASKVAGFHTVQILPSPTKAIVVSPDHIVQLVDGHIFSLVAAQVAGNSWKYGLVAFDRVNREGWHEGAVAGPTGPALVNAALTVLMGRPTIGTVVQTPFTYVKQG